MPSCKFLRTRFTLLLLAASLAAPVTAQRIAPRTDTAQSTSLLNLYHDEMQEALEKLRWRGERMADDTIYALALTGTSWQTFWNKKQNHLYLLAWGELKRVPSLRKRNNRESESLLTSIQDAYRRNDYRRVAQEATENFSVDEMGCNPMLKEAVGDSFLKLGETDKAFSVFVTPFEPVKGDTDILDKSYRFRKGAFEAAVRSIRRGEPEMRKNAIALGLSLLLEPSATSLDLNTDVLRYLEGMGVDIDKVCLGIVQAPERLPGLPAYVYSAMDILVYRAKPRMLPFFIHLAESGDVYLRSRAILGLGVLAYQERSGDPAGWERNLVNFPLRAYGLSVGERQLIQREAEQAARDGNYRLRTAGAMALALMGNEESVKTLQRLAKDRAYTLSPEERGRRDASRKIGFSVRMAAAAGLARFGTTVDVVSGELSGKELDKARRGGQDVSKERGGLDRDCVAQIFITPIDFATAVPFEHKLR
ncbi:MAG: HEAT repeat domain-containing protein [Armatimonadetes bacterium]|nr:HEAT repeat domain-containing protein [Armatimonadota bacterium]